MLFRGMTKALQESVRHLRHYLQEIKFDKCFMVEALSKLREF